MESPQNGKSAVVAALTAPFDPSQIKSRPVGGGREASYLSFNTVVERLNHAAPEWSFEVRKEWSSGNSSKALVRITIPGLGSREHIGVMELDSNSGADALAKGAVSDGLKKAATLFGVGLDLVSEEAPTQQWSSPQQQYPQQYQQQQGAQVPQQQQYQQPQQRPPQPPQQQRQQNGPKRYNPQYEDGVMASEAQGRKLYVSLQQTGLQPEAAAHGAGVNSFTGVGNLTKRQISAMIDWLSWQPGGENNGGQPAPAQQQQRPAMQPAMQGGPVYDEHGNQVLPDHYYDESDMDEVPFD